MSSFLCVRVVVISSESGDLFMGFIANMRLASDPNVIVGRVIESQENNTSVKAMTCNGTNVSYYKFNIVIIERLCMDRCNVNHSSFSYMYGI